MSTLASFYVTIPSCQEQVSIATFLDHETAKIDALIAEQQRLIVLLQEKRQAVISHAVTKGLNLGAPMKDSGVEWLGEVPEHWEVIPLKHLATVQTGMAKGKDLEGIETVDVPYLRVANVQDGYLDLDEVHLLSVPITSIDRYLLKDGDVLMNEGGDFDKLGRGCIWSGEIEPCVHQNHVFAVRPHSVTGEWLNTYTTSKAANSYFISRSKQSTNLASISSSNLMGLSVPLPPAEEARGILVRLNELVKEIDDLKHSATQATDLLQERRSALISAAVTGQIDVRGLVPEAVAARAAPPRRSRCPAQR
jgi:type I restriction enzyme S subunit